MPPLRVASVAFMASIFVLVSSYASNEVVSPPGNPGVERPVVAADVLVYTFESLAVILVAIGVTALITASSSARRWLSSQMAVIFIWIAAVFFMFVTLGRQEQYELYQAGREDLLMMGRLPGWGGFYSAGFLFFGASMALLGATLARLKLTHRAFSTAGIVLGCLLVVAGYARLVLGRQGVSDDLLTPFSCS